MTQERDSVGDWPANGAALAAVRGVGPGGHAGGVSGSTVIMGDSEEGRDGGDGRFSLGCSAAKLTCGVRLLRPSSFSPPCHYRLGTSTARLSVFSGPLSVKDHV